MQERAAAISPELHRAMRDIKGRALEVAREMSSGPYGDPAVLRALGHPYSRRHPRPIGAFYPAKINVNTGDFRSRWRGTVTRRGLQAGGASITMRLSNNSPHARYLTERGTSRMIGRPIQKLIVEKTRDYARKRIANAYKSALRKGTAGGTVGRAWTGTRAPRMTAQPLNFGNWNSRMRAAFDRGYRETKRTEERTEGRRGRR